MGGHGYLLMRYFPSAYAQPSVNIKAGSASRLAWRRRMAEHQQDRWLMAALSAVALFAVTAMVVCYALEQRSPWFTLGFAAACALGSLYGFLQGAWPFGLVELVWPSLPCSDGAAPPEVPS